MPSFGRRPELVNSNNPARQLRVDDDKRFAPRRSGETQALVLFDGAMESYPFVIVDISATGSTTGVRLEWRKSGVNPFAAKWDDIERIRLSDHVMYDCKIVRRSDTEIGVKFAVPKAVTRVSRPTR
jgi:hypothetical protein